MDNIEKLMVEILSAGEYDIMEHKESKSGTVRVIYNETKVNLYCEDPNLEEIVIKSDKIDNNFLRHLYQDPVINTYTFFNQICSKNHRFSKENSVLYFYKEIRL